MPLHFTPKDVDRFWAKVHKTDGCWLWTGGMYATGYGFTGTRKRRLYAHRVAYMLTYGPIPDGMQVCHHCDTPPCVRPDHLFLGNHAENAADRIAKGRLAGVRADMQALVEKARSLRATPEDRFWQKVEVTDTCWLWSGATDRDGYGKLEFKGRHYRPHRLAYELTQGSIPDGLLLRHTCDNRLCVRPGHLIPGTQQDNIQDREDRSRTAKGETHWSHRYPQEWEQFKQRQPGRPRATKAPKPLRVPVVRVPMRGETNGNARLTADQVIEIRRQYSQGIASQPQLAARFNVNQATIWRVVHRKVWKHIP